MEQKEIPLIVTTEHRGVFFGYGQPTTTEKTITLKEAQMCIYWSESVKGVVGLAATGPDANSRVSKPAPAITLQGVTAIIEVTQTAEAAWKKQPWG